MNKTQTTAAVCEIELKNGHNCGILAIGHCIICERAFCHAHEALQPSTSGFGNFYPSGQCISCFSGTWTDAKEQWQKIITRINEARDYFSSGAARTALLTSGVQPIVIHWHFTKEKRGIFGSRPVDAIASGRGWILGEFKWHWNNLVGSGGGWGANDVYERFGENMLTALMDETPVRPISPDTDFDSLTFWDRREFWYASYELAAVRYTSESYELVCRGASGGSNTALIASNFEEPDVKNWPTKYDGAIPHGTPHDIVSAWFWVKLEQAVRQLTKASS